MRATVRCAVCGNLFEPERSPAMPFCSHRCRQIDLHRWLGEEYGLPFESEDQPSTPPERVHETED